MYIGDIGLLTRQRMKDAHFYHSSFNQGLIVTGLLSESDSDIYISNIVKHVCKKIQTQDFQNEYFW